MPTFIRRLAICLLICLAAVSCMKQPVGPEKPPEPAATVSLAELTQRADEAYDLMNYQQAELLYDRLLARDDLPGSEKERVYEFYTRSALDAGHPRNALSGLDRWAVEFPQARQTATWRELHLLALNLAGETGQAVADLAGVLAMADVDPAEAHSAATDYLELVASPDDPASMEMLRAVHAASSPTGRRALETAFTASLGDLSDEELSAMLGAAEMATKNDFPYALLRFETARRSAMAGGDWPEAWQRMRSIIQSANIEDKEALAAILAGLEETRGIPSTGVALALPLSGRFQEVGWKILRGATVAQWELAREGSFLDVRAVNTDAEDWTTTLSELDATFPVVGGPVDMQSLKRAQSEGLTSERAFFAFLPDLGGIEEGVEAWRFFTGFADQIRALLTLAMDEMGMSRFAILYPSEPYGLRMSQVFWREAAMRGGVVTGLASYPPGQPVKWADSVVKLLNIPEKENDDEIVIPPDPDFEAVFMPDGWSQAQLLAPQFFFQEEDRLLFLGPEIWSQALTNARGVETRYFRLAACPGAWWPEARSYGVLSLRRGLDDFGMGEPDFWTALGYDFVRFMASLEPLAPGAGADAVNTALNAADFHDFSLAPLSYDETGYASQWLYIFRPSKNGLELLDPGLLRMRLDTAAEHHANRVEALKAKIEGIEPGQETLPDSLEEPGPPQEPETLPTPRNPDEAPPISDAGYGTRDIANQ